MSSKWVRKHWVTYSSPSYTRFTRCDGSIIFDMHSSSARFLAYGPVVLIGNFETYASAMQALEQNFPFKVCSCTPEQILYWEIQQAKEEEQG